MTAWTWTIWICPAMMKAKVTTGPRPVTDLVTDTLPGMSVQLTGRLPA
jgi:hypothetical protein